MVSTQSSPIATSIKTLRRGGLSITPPVLQSNIRGMYVAGGTARVRTVESNRAIRHEGVVLAAGVSRAYSMFYGLRLARALEVTTEGAAFNLGFDVVRINLGGSYQLTAVNREFGPFTNADLEHEHTFTEGKHDRMLSILLGCLAGAQKGPIGRGIKERTKMCKALATVTEQLERHFLGAAISREDLWTFPLNLPVGRFEAQPLSARLAALAKDSMPPRIRDLAHRTRVYRRRFEKLPEPGGNEKEIAMARKQQLAQLPPEGILRVATQPVETWQECWAFWQSVHSQPEAIKFGIPH